MDISECCGEIRISNIACFNLNKTFECGQCFRWNADDSGVYTGVAFGKAVKLRQEDNDIFVSCNRSDFETLWRNYFDLNRDYTQILTHLTGNVREYPNISEFFGCAVSFGAGIRILRQEPWEALCSFIISQNNNIPRIRNIIDMLCRMFGMPLSFDGKILYTFPDAKTIANLRESDMTPLRCGYRAGYILATAKAVSSESLSLTELSSLPPGDVRLALKRLPGVGDKVADCVMLYGLHMLNSFPVDTWIGKAISEHLAPDFDISLFSPYAGIAQQYIFHYIRNCGDFR